MGRRDCAGAIRAVEGGVTQDEIAKRWAQFLKDTGLKKAVLLTEADNGLLRLSEGVTFCEMFGFAESVRQCALESLRPARNEYVLTWDPKKALDDKLLSNDACFGGKPKKKKARG